MNHIAKAYAECLDERDALREEVENLRRHTKVLASALINAEVCLSLAANPYFPDPSFQDEIDRLGEKIGYGNLMATAAACWDAKAKWLGLPGSAFVSGPCRATVESALVEVRSAISAFGPSSVDEAKT